MFASPGKFIQEIGISYRLQDYLEQIFKFQFVGMGRQPMRAWYTAFRYTIGYRSVTLLLCKFQFIVLLVQQIEN